VEVRAPSPVQIQKLLTAESAEKIDAESAEKANSFAAAILIVLSFVRFSSPGNLDDLFPPKPFPPMIDE